MSTPPPANCSGLANSGVPAKAPGIEIPASEADSTKVLAKPRSIILAVRLRSSFNLTMMFVGFEFVTDDSESRKQTLDDIARFLIYGLGSRCIAKDQAAKTRINMIA